MRKYILFITIFLLSVACTRCPRNYTDGTEVCIFPDYTDITVPSNIAPANFMIREQADKYYTLLKRRTASGSE